MSPATPINKFSAWNLVSENTKTTSIALVDQIRNFVDNTYLHKFPTKKERPKHCIPWLKSDGSFVTIRKQHISFPVDLYGTRGTQTSRTWRKNVGLCFLVHARKSSDGLPKHCIRKFAIEYDIMGVTIGRNFAQYIFLSFYIKMDIHAPNRTYIINHSWKSINVVANYFT